MLSPAFSFLTFQSRLSLRLPLSLVFAVVAMVSDTVKSLLDCKFRGTCLCAGPNLSWCPPFASLFGKMLAVPLLEVSIFKVGIRVGPTFAVMLFVFAAVCSVSLVLAQFDGNPHNWDRLRRCDHSGYSPPCGACEGVGGIVTSDTADDITIVPCKIEASSDNPVRPIWGDPFH